MVVMVWGTWGQEEERPMQDHTLLSATPGSCPRSEQTSYFYETFISFETSRNMPENLKTGMGEEKKTIKNNNKKSK